MKDNNIGAWIGSGVTLIAGGLSQDILQIVLLVIGILSAIFSLFINIYTWYKKAKADGKIDNDELDELRDIVNKHTKGNDHD